MYFRGTMLAPLWPLVSFFKPCALHFVFLYCLFVCLSLLEIKFNSMYIVEGKPPLGGTNCVFLIPRVRYKVINHTAQMSHRGAKAGKLGLASQFYVLAAVCSA